MMIRVSMTCGELVKQHQKLMQISYFEVSWHLCDCWTYDWLYLMAMHRQFPCKMETTLRELVITRGWTDKDCSWTLNMILWSEEPGDWILQHTGDGNVIICRSSSDFGVSDILCSESSPCHKQHRVQVVSITAMNIIIQLCNSPCF